MSSTTFRFGLVASLACALFACTTKTEIVHHVDSADPSEAEVEPGAGPSASSDAGAGDDDPASAPSTPSTPGTPSKPDADAGAPDAAPVPVPAGGKIVLTCPTDGFHQLPPVTIASLPSALLPRCSAATKTCAYAAATAQAYDACLAADTTPPAQLDGEPVDCTACDRTQGSYCLASACKSEFADYACCAQNQGEAACAGLLQAVTGCAATTGKVAFEACIDALVGACFP